MNWKSNIRHWLAINPNKCKFDMKRFMQTLIVTAGLILFLSINIYSQDKSDCNYEYKDKHHYLNAIQQNIDGISSSEYQDGKELSLAYHRIAHAYFCSSENLDSIEKYLVLVEKIVPGTICKLHKHMQNINIKYPTSFKYFVTEINPKLTIDFIANCDQKTKGPVDSISMRPIFQELLENDQMYRSKYDDLKNIDTTTILLQLQVDTANRRKFEDFIQEVGIANLNNNAKEKEVVFLILIHAPHQYIEQNSSLINELMNSQNVDMQDFIICRYFCNKYGQSPIGRYCAVSDDEELKREFELLFPYFFDTSTNK